MAMGKEEAPMPWKETCPMDERVRFMAEYLRLEQSMAELCRAYGISRKTGYKLVARYEAGGVPGLQDRSRAPHRHPNAVGASAVDAILAVRARHPRWGPRKLRAWLSARTATRRWPAASTIGAILQRYGLTVPRRRVRRVPPALHPLAACGAPNDVWTTDFKGWFRTGDGQRCDPLTVADGYSRFLLRCQAVMPPDGQAVQPLFEAAFREYGLPLALRSDNGPPFASRAAGGLSRLAVWWIKLGIRPERITPGHPEENGRHERMHQTLKAETARPPQATLRAQQRAFDRFRHEYNDERPHEALAQQPPRAVYTASPRPYPARVREPEYSEEADVRRVRHNGEIRWQGQLIFISEVLAGEPVGIVPQGEDHWVLRFGPVELGWLDSDTDQLHRPRRPAPRGGLAPSHKVLPMCPVQSVTYLPG
jgi:transposase InsO family protein